MKEFIVTVNKKGFIVKVSDEGLLKAYAECTEDLIRCKDCIHWDDHLEECSNSDSVCFRNGMTGADWFCADGEKRE